MASILPKAAQTKKNKNPTFFFSLSKRLNELRLFYEAGVVAALHDALQMLSCDEDEINPNATFPTPHWMVAGSAKIVGERLSQGKSIGKGQSGNEKKKYANDMKDYYRWITVRRLLDVDGVLWKDVFIETSERLKNTFAGNVGEEAIKKSYSKVNNAMKDPEKALRYYRAQRQSQILAGTSL